MINKHTGSKIKDESKVPDIDIVNIQALFAISK